MIYISAQPDETRFIWEIEVQHYNFKQNGIDLKQVYAIFGYKNTPSVALLKLKEQLESNIILIEDTRIEPIVYSPTIKPHLLKKFYKLHENLIDEKCFYHDSDIIFTYTGLPNFDSMNNGWYVSDSTSYMNYEYIITKGTDVLLDICEIFTISPSQVRRNNKISGGCQYVFYGTDYDFWQEVETKSEQLFELSHKDKFYADQWSKMSGRPATEYHGLQWWCAEMWATLYTSFKRGFATNLHKELEFSWGSSYGDFGKFKIFHNAGITNEMEQFAFNKNSYKTRVPYFDNFDYIPDGQNTKKYVEEILKAGKYFKYID
jgi:hypothetical protein